MFLDEPSRFWGFVRGELLRTNEQRLWMRWLVAGLGIGLFAQLVPFIGHANCATVWDVIALALSVLLGWIYYKQLLETERYDSVLRKRDLISRWPKVLFLASSLILTTLASLVAIFIDWQVLIAVQVFVLGLLGLALVFFGFDRVIWTRAAEKLAEAEAVVSAGATGDDLAAARQTKSDMSSLVSVTRRATLYANLPVTVGLLGVLLFLVLDVYLWKNGDSTSLQKIVGGMSAAHVLSGNLVIGVLLKES